MPPGNTEARVVRAVRRPDRTGARGCGAKVSSVWGVTDVAIAAPNEAAADAGERTIRSGGNAVDAALAAVLVTMVNEVGVVTLSSGGFVTVQPGGVGAAYTVD